MGYGFHFHASEHVIGDWDETKMLDYKSHNCDLSFSIFMSYSVGADYFTQSKNHEKLFKYLSVQSDTFSLTPITFKVIKCIEQLKSVSKDFQYTDTCFQTILKNLCDKYPNKHLYILMS